MGMYVSFYVKVEGQSHSRHRSPEGVYQVDVLDDVGSVHTSAFAALSSAITNIPFLQDDHGRFSIRLFTDSGDEIKIPVTCSEDMESKACFCGRSSSYPSSIDTQYQ